MKVNSRADRPDGEPDVTEVAVGTVVARIEFHAPRAVDVARVDMARPVGAAGANVEGTRIGPEAGRRQENVIAVRRGNLITVYSILRGPCPCAFIIQIRPLGMCWHAPRTAKIDSSGII